MADPKVLAEQFSKAYYDTFDGGRQALVNFYHDGARMTFEGVELEGKEKIAAKIAALPFQAVQHVVTTCDVQPIPGGQGGNIIMVMGQLKTDGDPPHGFSQVFTIFPFNGSYVIVNDIFRLGLHNG